MNAIDCKFEEWFVTKYGPVKDQEQFFKVAKEAYEQALIDVWDLPILDVCAVAEKHGRTVLPSGKVVPHTAAEMLADPDGYDEYDPMMVEAKASAALVGAFEPMGVTTGRIQCETPNKSNTPKKDRRDLTLYPHCTKHPRYHGLRYPQQRKGGWSGYYSCAECEEVYKQVQEFHKTEKKKAEEAEKRSIERYIDGRYPK